MNTDIDLNKTEFANEDELKSYLLDLTTTYAIKMNQHEEQAYQAIQKREADWMPFKQSYQEIFQAFCTNKKRVYGGQFNAIGITPKYCGVDTSCEKSVTLKNKSRAEVYFKVSEDEKNKSSLLKNDAFLFVVLRKNNVWRIDSFKYQFLSEKWGNGIL